MIPSGDRIVPPLSASALADPKRGLKNVTRLDLPLGHIGMVVSGRARELCWTPLIDWLLPAYLLPALMAVLAHRSAATARPPALRRVLGGYALIAGFAWIVMTPDGRVVVYNYNRSLGTVYQISGLK